MVAKLSYTKWLYIETILLSNDSLQYRMEKINDLTAYDAIVFVVSDVDVSFDCKFIFLLNKSILIIAYLLMN